MTAENKDPEAQNQVQRGQPDRHVDSGRAPHTAEACAALSAIVDSVAAGNTVSVSVGDLVPPAADVASNEPPAMSVVPGSRGYELHLKQLFVALAHDPDHARRLAACWNAFEGVETKRFEGKSLSDFVGGEAYLNGMNPAPAGFHMGMSGLACQMLTESFAGQFAGAGAINFLEVGMEHEELGPFTVTIQRAQGKTPGQLRAEALTDLAEARALLTELVALETKDGVVEGCLTAKLRSLVERAGQVLTPSVGAEPQLTD